MDKATIVIPPKQAQSAKGAMEDAFEAALFVYVGTQYFGMQEHEVVQFLTNNGVKQLTSLITLRKFSPSFSQP